MARLRSGRLALAVFLVALAAVLAAAGVAAALAMSGRAAAHSDPAAAAAAAVDRAHAALAAAERERLLRIGLTARLLAREGALVDVLGGAAGEPADPAEGAAALADLLAQRRPELGFDLAMVLDREGRVVASGGGVPVARGTDLAADPLVAAALAEGSAAGAWRSDGGLAHVAVERVAPDFELLGHVLAGAAIDRVFVLEVARGSGAEVTFVTRAGDGGLEPAVSSLGGEGAAALVAAVAADDDSLGDALAAGEARELPRIELDGETRAVMAVPLAAPAGTPAAVALLAATVGAGGLAARLAPLAIGGALGLLVALVLAPLVARRALAPAGRLTAAVEAAPRESFARRLEPARYRALGPLAAALDRLFQVLHQERSLGAATAAARRLQPSPVPAAEDAVVERGVVALFELRRHARLGDDPTAAAAGLAGDLGELRRVVASAGGRVEAIAGHRVLAVFTGAEAHWQALSAAASVLTALAAAPAVRGGEAEPAAAALAGGDLVRAATAGGGVLLGPAVQLAESVLREATPGEVTMSRAVERAVAERLAAYGFSAGEQRGLLSPQPLFVVGPAAVTGIAALALAPAEPAGPAAGTTFARRFQVLGRLGRTAGAELWRVRDEESGRDAALKWLPQPDPLARREALGLEGRLDQVRRLDHPGLAAVAEVGETGEGTYLAREWVEGVPLADFGELPPAAALALARQLAAILAAVHREGMVHGRVKPENVIVEADGRARLVDLGVGAVAGPAPSASAGDRLLAPEQRQAVGPAAAGDARADVYALAALLHRVALGRWPGEPAGEGDPAAGGALAAVLGRATAEDPEKRPADAVALAAGLEGVTA